MARSTSRLNFLRCAAALGLMLATGQAIASGGHSGGHGHGDSPDEAAIGAPGEAADAGRTIELRLNEMSFSEDAIRVEGGETIRFVLINEGDLVHEFSIGTAEMHAAHEQEMEAMIESGMLEADRINPELAGGMAHDDPNSVLLAPGETSEVIWRFPEDATLEFSCNIPGHRDGGMVGSFDFGHSH